VMLKVHQAINAENLLSKEKAHIRRKLSAVVDTSRRCGYGLKICTTGFHEVMKNFGPVLSRIPANFAWGIDFNGHDLADGAALDQDDCCPDASVTTATVLASLNIGSNQRISIGDI